MNLQTILELWATHSPTLLHSRESNKRVFFVRGVAAVPDFTRTLPRNISPCILFDLHHDVEYISEGKKNVAYTIYFCAKSAGMKPNDDLFAVDAIETTEKLIEEFREFIIRRQDDNDFDFLSISTEFSTFPYGPLFDGWFATACALNKIERISLCK